MKSGKVYAIITARGGSKGIPRKNIQPLEGKPLIAYSIKAALDCPLIGRCLVSTEDSEIKKESLNWGAEIIERPLELAADLSLSQDAVRHVLETLRKEGDFPDYFVLLQPTSPLRNSNHLQRCIEQFMQSDANCAISVVEAEHHPFKFFRMNQQNQTIEPLFDVASLDKPRQSLPPIYRQNGAIYLMASELFLNVNCFFAQPAMPFVMSSEESIDIDTSFDLFMAAEIIKRKHSGVETEEEK